MLKHNHSLLRGFTLIELLVAIAIIARLMGILMSNFGTARSKSRDGKRISDLGNVQLALETYYDRCKSYPTVSSGAVNPTSGCTTSSGVSVTFVPDFISRIPTPSSGTYAYEVKSGSTDYILMSILENYSEVLKDDIDDYSGSWFSTSCGTVANGQGNNERNYCISSK